MKKLLLASSAAAALLASVSSANAADPRWPYWYIGLSGSVGFLNDSDLDDSVTGDAEFDNGWGLGGQLGYTPAWGHGVRMELDVYHRRNDFENITIGGVGSTASGDIDSTAYMFNVLYDFRNQSGFTPYVGAGLGWAHLNADTDAGGFSIDDSDDGLAWQAMAGIAYAPRSMPMTEWSLGYRYFSMTDVSLDSTAGTVDMDYDVHNLEAGVKFRF